MDKIIEKKKGLAAAFTGRALPYWLGAFVVVFVLWLIFRDNSSTLRVNGETLSYGNVVRGCPKLDCTNTDKENKSTKIAKRHF